MRKTLKTCSVFSVKISDLFTTSILYSEEHKDLKELIPFIDNYTTIENKPTAYVCENFVCHEPITDGALLREKLNR